MNVKDLVFVGAIGLSAVTIGCEYKEKEQPVVAAHTKQWFECREQDCVMTYKGYGAGGLCSSCMAERYLDHKAEQERKPKSSSADYYWSGSSTSSSSTSSIYTSQPKRKTVMIQHSDKVEYIHYGRYGNVTGRTVYRYDENGNFVSESY